MRIKFLIVFLTVFSNLYADSWVQKLSLTGGQRDGAVGFSIGNKGYIGTGYNHGASYYYKDFWEYDPDSDTWTQKADFGGGYRSDAVSFSVGAKGYIGTGLGPTGYQNDFWEWDQVNNIWIRKTDFAGAFRAVAVAFSIGTNGYIGTGGRNAPFALYKDFWEWNGDTSSTAYNTWIQKSVFGGIARSGATGFSIGTKGYIGTGSTDGTNLGATNDFWEWDQPSDTWTQKGNFGGAARAVDASFSIGQKGYVGTGADINGIRLKDFWEYNQTTDAWVQKNNFGGSARTNAVGFSIGSKGYLGMGFFFTVSTNDFWEYCDTCSVGIEELNNSLSAQIFPNPVTDNLIIAVNKQYDFMKAELYSISGTKVFDKEYRNIHSSFQINISEYQSGIYFLKLNDNANSITKKIIIQ